MIMSQLIDMCMSLGMKEGKWYFRSGKNVYHDLLESALKSTGPIIHAGTVHFYSWYEMEGLESMDCEPASETEVPDEVIQEFKEKHPLEYRNISTV